MPAQDGAWKREQDFSSSSFTTKRPASSEWEWLSGCTKGVYSMWRWVSRWVLRHQVPRDPWLAGGPTPGELLGTSSGDRAGCPLQACRRLRRSDLRSSD